MQPRFNEYLRRKALAWIRLVFVSYIYDFITVLCFSRQVPKIRHENTERERATMAFPINIIEEAYDENPFYFRDLSDLYTYSENKPLMEELKNPGDGQPRGDGKPNQNPGVDGTAVQLVTQASKPPQPQPEQPAAASDGDVLKQAPTQLRTADSGLKKQSKKKSKKSKKSQKKM